MDWWNQNQDDGDWWQRQSAPDEPQKQGFFGGLASSIEGAAKNAGNFFGGIAKSVASIIPDTVNDFKETVKTLRDITLSPNKQREANIIIDQVDELNKN